MCIEQALGLDSYNQRLLAGGWAGQSKLHQNTKEHLNQIGLDLKPMMSTQGTSRARLERSRSQLDLKM